MALYIYKCTECGLTREIQHPMNEKRGDIPCSRWRKDGTHNPDCKGMLRKIITGTNFVLKGGTWAKDGYK